MYKHISLLFLFLCLVFSKQSYATTITFNEFALGTVVDDEYVNIGLSFTTSGVDVAQIVDITPDTQIPSSSVLTAPAGPNGLRIISNTFTDILTVNFHPTFDLSVTGTASSFSFEFVSDAVTTGTVDNGTLRAFDINGVLLAEELSGVGGSGSDGIQGLETLAVISPNIFRVEISGFRDVIIDSINFEFSNISAVPLPAALPLFGSGLALMGLIGWRRKRLATIA